MDEPTKGREWGNVRFRRNSRSSEGSLDDSADSRFWIGLLVFLMVALAYPWYSYWVNAQLLSRSFQKAADSIGRELDVAARQSRQKRAANTAQRKESERSARIANVRVVGVSPNRAGPVAIVRLGNAGLAESTLTICRQSEVMLGSSLDGQLLRVQEHRGSQPAISVGNIRC
ncbi:hypothetical protein [Novilysobacter antarcticus]|uniref:hypothetical protein n=1 Tax=Novilysobacter antarcticus TaxID=2862543 RepID=UPI001C99C675|nr:hypothetical protein [Lysobacter antarcticus]